MNGSKDLQTVHYPLAAKLEDNFNRIKGRAHFVKFQD